MENQSLIKNNNEKIHSAVVIGGVNADIWGHPAGELKPCDSNPGFVTVKPGGVGRNIAHNLRLLGMDVAIITALGGDIYAGLIESSCASLGIDLSRSLRVSSMRSSVYLYVTGSDGDMNVGISDMDIINAITPEYLAGCMDYINSFDCAVIDANLSEEAIEYIAAECTVPLYADPVSTAKCGRLKPALPQLAAIKPNILEAKALTGTAGLEDAAAALVGAGVGRVFISLGSAGMLAADKNGAITEPAVPVSIVNANGAGDAAMAGIIYACGHGYSLPECARIAARCGALTAQSEETNCPNLRDALV